MTRIYKFENSYTIVIRNSDGYIIDMYPPYYDTSMKAPWSIGTFDYNDMLEYSRALSEAERDFSKLRPIIETLFNIYFGRD